MLPTTCAWVRSRLPLLAGGDALGLDHRRIERHVLRCPACRARLETLEVSQAVLAAAAGFDPTPIDSASLWPALSRQIHANPRPTVRSAWALRSTRRSPAWAWASPLAALAAGLLVALGVVAAMDRLTPRPSTRDVVVRSQFRPRAESRLLKEDVPPRIPAKPDYARPVGQPSSNAADTPPDILTQ